MTDELKPCPFCGGKPQPRLDDCINGKMVENPMFYIACENLGCGVWPEAEGRYETQYDAIVAAWNRRSLPAAEAGAGALGAVATINEELNTDESVAFWNWLPLAYRDGHLGENPKFTKYNMEVSHLAGWQHALKSIEPPDHAAQPEVTALLLRDPNQMCNALIATLDAIKGQGPRNVIINKLNDEAKL